MHDGCEFVLVEDGAHFSDEGVGVGFLGLDSVLQVLVFFVEGVDFELELGESGV